MAITRRQFIKRTGFATAGALLGPSLFGSPFVRQAMASTIGTRYLIAFFLEGGNDGFNTVIPVSDGSLGGTLRTAYENARGTGGGGLRLTAGPGSDLALSGIGADFLTNTPLALHPGFRGFQGFDGITAGNGGLKAVYDAGDVAVVQGCGYPNYSLSHEEARVIWQTANPQGLPALLGTGWQGRTLTAGGYASTDIPAVAIERSVSLDLTGSSTSVLAISRLEDFSFPYDYDYTSDETAKHDTFDDLYTLAGGGAQPLLQYVGANGSATLLSTERYPGLHDLYLNDRAAFDDLYSEINRGPARDLREIAKIIYGAESAVPNINAHFFELSNGGYDTHSDQGAADQDGQHYQLHAEVGAALKVFRDDLRDMGQALHGDPDAIWGRTTILVWSEFSRRIEQNDNGTDHGSQGPMFVIGGKVRGGVYGHHPNVNDAARDDEGNTVYHHTGDQHDSTDLRDVYGTVLKHWVNVPPATVASILPTDTVPSGEDPDLYWTTANFDVTRPSDGLSLFKP